MEAERLSTAKKPGMPGMRKRGKPPGDQDFPISHRPLTGAAMEAETQNEICAYRAQHQ